MVADTSDSTQFRTVRIRKEEESDDNDISDEGCDPEDNPPASAINSDSTQPFTLNVRQWVIIE